MANIILESARGLQPVPIEDLFLKDRQIFLSDDITDRSCNEVIKQLMFLEKEDHAKEIIMYINSPGGSVSAGLALFDVMMLLKAPIKTICTGVCMSMGAIIFLAGKQRLMLPSSRLMIHDPAFGGEHNVGGKKPHEIQAELDDLNSCREVLAKIIADRTGKDIEEVYKVTEKDSYFTAKEAKDFKLATGIITKKGGLSI